MANNGNKVRATIATVKIGHLEFEGLYIDETKSFGVGVPQIADLFPYFQDSRNQASQKLKRLMGKDFKTSKVKTDMNRNNTLMVTLDGFLDVIKKLRKAHDSVAEEITDQLIGLSLTQLFSDAFNIHFEKEHRQLWLKARQEGKIMRRELTDAIADYLARTPSLSETYRVYVYGNVTNILYKGLFARNAQELKASWGIQKKQETPREKMTPEELIKIQGLEDLTARLIDSGSEPMQAANEAITRLIFPVIER